LGPFNVKVEKKEGGLRECSVTAEEHIVHSTIL
jgi:hypothetical protein